MQEEETAIGNVIDIDSTINNRDFSWMEIEIFKIFILHYFGIGDWTQSRGTGEI